jgi:membrane-bound lytic murein transglycosylase D
LPGIKFAEMLWNRPRQSLPLQGERRQPLVLKTSLALLALYFSHPAAATAPIVLKQTLEWRSEAVSSLPENEAGAAVAETETTSEDNVWQRVRSGFKIDDDAYQNPLVGVHESWFAARPENVRRLAERARPYLYHIVEELEQRAMPMEIALLPMIESAFVPTALSPSAASGIWQFIPSTGSHYGLRQDNWYDGRRDFTAATNAALDYLGKLYLDFGDWQLALAAYNCGEGCVARAIQKNVQMGLPTDYASLSLPNETRHYVPKLLAINNLVNDPESYGIAIDTLPNQPYFNQVTVHANMDIHSAARLAGMSSDDFFALNAAFPRKLIRSDTPVNLLVPVDKTDHFQRNLETGNWDSWQPHTAQKGERPEAIAQRFGTSVARLQEHNQLQLKHGKLVRTQTILVPVKRREVVTAGTPAAIVSPAAVQHVVQSGDTLFGVARRYGLNLAQLTEANPALDSQLKPGQRIRLPANNIAVQEVPAIQPASFKTNAKKTAQPLRYTVKRGDTLHAIAQRFDISLADIKTWNPVFKKSSRIQAGQTVIVRKP